MISLLVVIPHPVQSSSSPKLTISVVKVVQLENAKDEKEDSL